MISCLLCEVSVKNYRYLSHHIRKAHNISAKQYVDTISGIGLCKECGNHTKFKNIQIGYRNFCSVACLNRYKLKDKDYINALSMSQKGIPRKKHSEATKRLISKNSKNSWSKNRDKYLSIFRSVEYRAKASKKTSELGHRKITGQINGIYYESEAEKSFIELAFNNNFLVRRFGSSLYGEKPYIDLGNRCVIPDFVSSELMVEVKDFHHWFRKELFSGLEKYKKISEWGRDHDYFFIFWFKKYGFIHLEELLYIKDDNDLKKFKNEKLIEIENIREYIENEKSKSNQKRNAL